MPKPRTPLWLASISLWIVLVACNHGGATKDQAHTAGTAQSTANASQGAERRYDVERGVVEYTVDGMELGTETMRFKNYGLLEVRQRESKMQLPQGLHLPAGAAPEHKRLVSIIDGTTIINYDPDRKVGSKTLNSLELLGGAKRFQGKSMVEVGKQMYAAMGGVQSGTKTIAGKTCDVWKIEKISTESCIYKGITLEVTTELVGMKQHSVATKIDFDASVDDSWFVVPKDVTLRETDLSKQRVPPAIDSAMPTVGLPGKTGTTISPEEALRMMRQGAQK
jgi:hypothetical protein